MPDSTTMTIRVDRTVRDRLEKVATATRRSKSFLAAEAIEEFLRVQEWQEQRVRSALQSVASGEGVAHEDVAAWVSSWNKADEQPPPKA